MPAEEETTAKLASPGGGAEVPEQRPGSGREHPGSISSLLSAPRRIFLLSPASIFGVRAGWIMKENAKTDLACRLHQGGAPLGELFSFMSSLYFRGKLAYARAFADAPAAVGGVFVITASGGLVPPDTLVTIDRLREISAADVDPEDARYRAPLHRDATGLAKLAGNDCAIVLLGSIATPKYVNPLCEVFGRQLLFPVEFVGRGDMSRGGLLLRCVEAGRQLTYIPVLEATRHGRRPPKLPSLRRQNSSAS